MTVLARHFGDGDGDGPERGPGEGECEYELKDRAGEPSTGHLKVCGSAGRLTRHGDNADSGEQWRQSDGQGPTADEDGATHEQRSADPGDLDRHRVVGEHPLDVLPFGSLREQRAHDGTDRRNAGTGDEADRGQQDAVVGGGERDERGDGRDMDDGQEHQHTRRALAVEMAADEHADPTGAEGNRSRCEPAAGEVAAIGDQQQ